MATDPRTQAYVARRTAEGKTTREINRCLKRYAAREVYKTLTAGTRQQHQFRQMTHDHFDIGASEQQAPEGRRDVERRETLRGPYLAPTFPSHSAVTCSAGYVRHIRSLPVRRNQAGQRHLATSAAQLTECPDLDGLILIYIRSPVQITAVRRAVINRHIHGVVCLALRSGPNTGAAELRIFMHRRFGQSHLLLPQVVRLAGRRRTRRAHVWEHGG